MKQLFKLVDGMFSVKSAPILPTHDSLEHLVESFSDFFESKINNIRCSLSQQIFSWPKCETNASCSTSFSQFDCVSTNGLKTIIQSSKSKSCALDPIPTWLLKDCIDVLLPILTDIMNASLDQGIFPSLFKKSLVHPLIKKDNLDADVFANYRPISNLSFLSKTLERIVASQIEGYLTTNGLFAKMQSAYRKHHSTETALLRVVNDIHQAIDNKCEAVLVLLDLSAAFDTIDHAILLDRLRDRYGFSGTVLRWIESYLKDRPQCIVLDKILSRPRYLSCGVPQGSVLGPLLFSLYIAPLEDIISAHGLDAMMYADDTQLYIFMRKGNRVVALENLSLCLDDIMSWNLCNMLKCNPSKTEIIHFSSRFSPPEPIASIKVGHHNVQPTSVIKNLGVTLDSHLTFVPHVNNICRALSRSFHSIGRIRKYLSQADTERIVHAFVLSKLDYCNSLLYGLPSREIEKLQRLQNTAARLTVCMKKTDHITPVLKKLHWLPVNDRITFKLLLLTYKSLNGLAPVYINELLYHYTPCRSLRSSDSNFLAIPKTTTITYGDRSFAAIAPKLWNQLPLAIRQSDSVDSFKRAMKTYLFRESSLF